MSEKLSYDQEKIIAIIKCFFDKCEEEDANMLEVYKASEALHTCMSDELKRRISGIEV